SSNSRSGSPPACRPVSWDTRDIQGTKPAATEASSGTKGSPAIREAIDPILSTSGAGDRPAAKSVPCECPAGNPGREVPCRDSLKEEHGAWRGGYRPAGVLRRNDAHPCGRPYDLLHLDLPLPERTGSPERGSGAPDPQADGGGSQ